MVKSIKVTFTMDEATIRRLDNAAERLNRPKSTVVREAIDEYYARIGKLSEAEKLRMLADFDRLVPLIPDRPPEEVEKELAEVRELRKRGGRKSLEGERL
jgi:predicted transcriptional regulator